MPEGNTAPADGQQGDPPKGGEAASPPSPGKTLTQAEVDQIVADRVARERAKFADYEDLKAKAKDHDDAEEAKKDELQKAKDAQARADARADAAEAKANATARRAAIVAQAAAQKGDPEIVVALLADSAEIAVDKDGNVTGAKEAVAKLLKDKPSLLVSGTPGQSGGQFGGNDPVPIDQKIAELEKKGDRQSLSDALTLKMAKALGIKTA